MAFYTYMWLRDDGTPYYVGKGKGRRGFTNKEHRVCCPQEQERIIVQEWPCEVDAFEAEKFLIAYYGRIDLGTGCLRNLTNGGEGVLGFSRSAEYRKKLSLANMGKTRPYVCNPKMSIALLGNTNCLGNTLSEAHRNAVGNANRGRKRPDLSERNKQHRRFGWKHSFETLQKMKVSQAQRRERERTI